MFYGYLEPRPNSLADESSHLRAGPIRPETPAAARVLGFVSPAMYSAATAAADARSHDRAAALNAAFMFLLMT